MQLAIAVLTFLVSAMTAVVVHIKSQRSGTHNYFALLVFFIGIYPIFNYLALHASTNHESLYWAKAVLFVSIPQGPLLYMFARTFPSSRFLFSKWQQIVIVLWMICNMALAAAGLIFKGVVIHKGVAEIQPGALVPLFGLLQASTIIGGLVTLYLKLRRADEVNRGQLYFIFYGVFISFSLTFLITFILPVALNSTVLLAISPLFLGLSVVAAAYAIVAQRLFDIRFFVFRAAAYSFSVILMSILLVVPIVLLSAWALHIEFTVSRFFITVLIVLLIVVLSGYLRNRFDTLTNRIFLRGYYEPQDVLNQLSKVLVHSTGLEFLKHHSAEILQKALRPESIKYWINTSSGISTNEEAQMDRFAKLFRHHASSNIFVLDENDTDFEPVKQLREEGIAIIAKLRTTSHDIGYMTFGFKASGTLYSLRDRRVLSIAADEIAIAFQNAQQFQEIQNFNATLQEQVATATRQLRHTNSRLRALDNTKDEFITMASHQLRTPLTSVKGYLSMALEGDAGKLNANQRKLLEQSYASAQRMVYLISDLLNLSRLNTGKFVIDATPVQLADVVEAEVEQLAETARSRGVQLTYVPPNNLPELMLDETKIHQVVMNFMDNAIYYTPEGGNIDIKLRETPTAIEYMVTDNGIGVPKAEQHRLFTKFYRAGNARQARPDGTGLGLFMAKKVIVAQGGVILFTSVEGNGSSFGFRFSKANHLVHKSATV